MPDQDDPAIAPCVDESGALGHGDEVARQHVRVVRVGRRIRQAVATQIGRDGRDGSAQAPGNGRPAPGRATETMDQEHPVTGRIGRSTPVEEMDPLAGRDLDHEPARLGVDVRCRRPCGKGVGRQVHRA